MTFKVQVVTVTESGEEVVRARSSGMRRRKSRRDRESFFEALEALPHAFGSLLSEEVVASENGLVCCGARDIPARRPENHRCDRKEQRGGPQMGTANLLFRDPLDLSQKTIPTARQRLEGIARGAQGFTDAVDRVAADMATAESDDIGPARSGVEQQL